MLQLHHQAQSHHLQAVCNHRRLNKRKNMTMLFKLTKTVNGSYKTRKLTKTIPVSNILRIKTRPFTIIQRMAPWFMANKRSITNGTTSIRLQVPWSLATIGSQNNKKKFTMIQIKATWSMANKRSTATGNTLMMLPVLKPRVNMFGSVTKIRKFTMMA